MELISQVFYNLLHLQDSISSLIQNYGAWTYGIMFVVFFCETGLVITPFLPGDSLLFAAGAFAAKGDFNLWLLFLLNTLAAVLGDAVNYSIGYRLGPNLLRDGRDGRFLKRKYIDRTHQFYEKYGKKTIILARFVPIVRTFAPFLAGFGQMNYFEFAAYNVIGGVIWVVSLTLAGYFFGTIPWVEKHFEAVIIAIIFISILPMMIEYWRASRASKSKRAIDIESNTSGGK